MDPVSWRTLLFAVCFAARQLLPVSTASLGYRLLPDVCRFQCPGIMKPVPRPVHRGSPNGCGTKTISLPTAVLPHPDLEICCNSHDNCYDTCGGNKTLCDETLEKCMTGVCETDDETVDREICLATSRLLMTVTMHQGCDPFLQAQGEACACRAADEL